ncbi:purine-binding chemotaxis protein CheW [Massilia arenosa]|uniref:Chemotaxis protein CheW n=1 Tax=Zemynaea arenosa TaxID=2561931 RepID=A0A4Y9SB54_9BURK|nr:chemotaxis protein CheW [Massilia arenosa]TFW19192.1 purine-binding chemotaxis protein CheW [Massilia arenosa]
MSLSSSDAPAATASSHLEILAFRLGAEEYAIDIQAVQELRGPDAITRIANAPPWVRGVMNLRGLVVPVIDMRIRLGAPAATYDAFTVVIIVSLHGRVTGVVVDGVSDVMQVPRVAIKPNPLPESASRRWLLGVCESGARLLQLIDMHGLVDGSADLDAAAHSAPAALAA